MKRLYCLTLIISTLFSLCLSMPGYALGQEVALATTEYPPYYSQTLDNQGFITEIIVEAFKRTGFRTQIKFYPWKRAFITAKTGKCDGLYSVWHRKDREQWFFFSDALPPNELVFYKHKSDRITFKTYEDLKPYRIGVVRGYAYPPDFQKADYLHKIEVVDDEKNLERLCKHQNELILIDKMVAGFFMQTKFVQCAELLERIEPPIEILNQYLTISKQAQDAQVKLNAFNSGLRQIKNDGTVDKILKRHGY